MIGTVRIHRQTIHITENDYLAELVKTKFMKLDGEYICFVLDCMWEAIKIRNIK